MCISTPRYEISNLHCNQLSEVCRCVTLQSLLMAQLNETRPTVKILD